MLSWSKFGINDSRGCFLICLGERECVVMCDLKDLVWMVRVELRECLEFGSEK